MSGKIPDRKSSAEIEAIVRGFETCALPDSEFDHRAHLAVALSYLYRSRLTVEAATARMREGLYKYLDHHGHDRQKYNETITLFWVKRVRSFLDGADLALTLSDMETELAATCGGHPHLIFDYYSKKHLLSQRARETWVEPDLKPLDF
jgi:hypothetical protein